jgi:hypothetical protein
VGKCFAVWRWVKVYREWVLLNVSFISLFLSLFRFPFILQYFLHQVWVNGRLVGGHKGGFSPWRVEITQAVHGETTVPSEQGTHEVPVVVVVVCRFIVPANRCIFLFYFILFYVSSGGGASQRSHRRSNSQGKTVEEPAQYLVKEAEADKNRSATIRFVTISQNTTHTHTHRERHPQ